MSSSLDAGYWDAQSSKEPCKKSPNKKHKYKITCGVMPSCEMTCKYCGHVYYTK